MFLEIIYKSAAKIVKLEEEEIENPTTFISKVLDAFDISDRTGRKLVFLTQAGSVVPAPLLSKVVEQYKNCGCFVLRMVFTDQKEPQSDLAVRLKEYIVRHEGDDEFFVEESEDKLSQRSQDIVLNHVFEFLKSKYTLSIKPDGIVQICHAAIELFPSLKVRNSTIGGIDTLYDQKNRKGILYQKLIYSKRTKQMKRDAVLTNKRLRLDDIASNGVSSNGDQNNIETQGTVDDIEMGDAQVEDAAFGEVAKTLMSFLVKCKLPKDTSKVKKKFEETVELRKKMMSDFDTYKQLFDLFLVLPDLITFDFRLHFPGIDGEALHLVWASLKSNADKNVGKCSSIYDGELKKYKKNGDIKSLLKLIKLIPTHRKQFKTSVLALLKISEDINEDPMNLMSRTTDSMIIAIQAPNDSVEIKFYIQVKRHLISVKPGSDFVSVLDMYYKVHKLFGIDFCADCDQFMIFLDHFVYLHQDTRYKPNVKTVRISKHLL